MSPFNSGANHLSKLRYAHSFGFCCHYYYYLILTGNVICDAMLQDLIFVLNIKI